MSVCKGILFNFVLFFPTEQSSVSIDKRASNDDHEENGKTFPLSKHL